MKRRKQPGGLPALDLIEQSVHTLRTAPVSAWLAYYIGTAPFILGALFFWSEMSRSAFAEEHLMGGSIGLALLFVWMKSWQAVFGALVRAHVSRETLPPWTAARVARIAARQLIIQPSSFFLLPLALIAMLPFGWLLAFYQNVTVLGARGDEATGAFIKRAWRQATFAQGQHHVGFLLIFVFAAFVWTNLAITAIGVPFLGKTLLGIETQFTLGFASVVNTTFFAVICGLLYLTLDPLFKTTYVLRCFYGESRQTGEDLRVALRGFRPAATAALLLALLLGLAPAGRAADAKPAGQPVNPTELDRSIEDVLARSEYTWRAPRPKRERTGNAEVDGFLKRIGKWIGEAWDSFENWLRNLGRPRAGSLPGGFSLFTREGLIYTLIVVVALLLGVLMWLLWKIRLKRRAGEAEATAAVPALNLADENVTAEQLPEDGWLRMAMEMIERGDLRLALRAFYLASLAHLAERQLVTLAKFKSNRDYERELQRRSHALPEVNALFSHNVATFDRVWYGLHEVNPELVQHFRGNVERIKSC
jgi:hypothetical protein